MRCPVCRAENEEGPNCRRCRVDLSLLFTLEEQRQYVLHEARHALLAGQTERARALAEGADTLRHDEDTQRLLAVTSLVQRDFASALTHREPDPEPDPQGEAE